MTFDADAFGRWLLERGTPEAFLKPYLDGARKVVEAIDYPVDPAQAKAFIAGLKTTGAVPQTRIENYKRITAALLRFQERQRKEAVRATKAGRGHDGGSPPGGTQVGMGAAPAPAPAAAPEPSSGLTIASGDDGRRPTFTGAVAPPMTDADRQPRDEPIELSEPLPSRGRAAQSLGLVADGDVARGDGQRKGQIRFLDTQALPDAAGRRRRILLPAVVAAFALVGAYVVRETIDAVRFRSHAVPPNHYSEHLGLEIAFPATLGWRQLTSGDRSGPYRAIAPTDVGGATEASTRLGEQEFVTAAFYRGEEARKPDLGLTVVVVLLAPEVWNSPRGAEAELRDLGERLGPAVTEKVVFPDGIWRSAPCEYARAGYPVVRCAAQVADGRLTWFTPTFVIFGRDRATLLIFRTTTMNEEKRAEIEDIAISVHP